jgi:hypothetical protein
VALPLNNLGAPEEHGEKGTFSEGKVISSRFRMWSEGQPRNGISAEGRAKRVMPAFWLTFTPHSAFSPLLEITHTKKPKISKMFG